MQSYRTLTDGALLESVLTRDEQAWSELVRRYRGLIFRCITKVTSKYASVLSSDDVSEIFADVLVNLVRDDMRKLRAYDPARGSKLGSWIGLISIHTAYDYLRQHARQPMLDRLDHALERESADPSPEEAVMAHERWERLGRLLESFTARDRRFVDLYFSRGMAPEAVAEAMNISVKTVYSKKNKIRVKLERMTRRLPAIANDNDAGLPLAA
ncbi:MAG TPA: sigma-70 family RNA polymerase sigma factor [Polyangia bacterium]|nr:sigma-70 family RNA polymerase sigma factor [Polyangia bacterium]